MRAGRARWGPFVVSPGLPELGGAGSMTAVVPGEEPLPLK